MTEVLLHRRDSRLQQVGKLLRHAAVACALAATSLAAPAQAADQILKITTWMGGENWSPLRGGGTLFESNNLWNASPMYFDPSGELHPYVFATWDHNDDYTVWTFTIDPKAQFSDASPITAAEVKGSFELAAMPSTKSQRVDQVLGGVVGFEDVSSGAASEISGIVVKDDRTLEIQLKSSDPIFFLRLASQIVAIVKASEARDENGEEKFEWWHPDNGVPVSGPFVPVTMDIDGGTFVLEPNPNFFGPAPKLERIELNLVADLATQVALIQSGQYHGATEIVSPTLIQDFGADFAEGPVIPRGHHFWFNTSVAPTNDPNVRKALIMAVDRAGLMEATYPLGPHPRAEQLLNAVAGVDPNWEPYPYDPAAAKQALADSSFGGPETLPLILFGGTGNAASETAAQYIAEQWRQNLGIERVELKPVIDSATGGAQIQVFRDDIGTRVPDAVAYLMGAIHSSSSNAKDKLGGYANPEVDRLLEEASVLSLEDPQRDEKAREAQRLFREDWVYLPWHYSANSKFHVAAVKDAEKDIDWQISAPWGIYIE